MKLLFLTTTAVALGSFTTSSAHSFAADTVSPAQYTQMIEAVTTTSATVGLHAGDFQANTRAAIAHDLYKGDGASLMVTIRRHRD